MELLLHILFSTPLLDSLLGIGFFFAGRFSGGMGLFLRVAILLIRMSVHFYKTYPHLQKLKKTSTIDEEFDKLYKDNVVPLENRLKQSSDTGAKG